eukprot:NODE_2007_length_2313_cov_7.493596.p1 GENE.NODE_2007_length_2313_cov_7.493596~~NODE_2007_length_2313_cov_7.493596.p1  ORF type:complete len:638 (-),score=133.38 NODE_2007_length_2313_cov_7.493596:270-2183(-)
MTLPVTPIRNACLGALMLGAVGVVVLRRRQRLARARIQKERTVRKRALRDAKHHPVLMEALARRSEAEPDHKAKGELEQRIVKATATELRRMMACKEVTCEDVMVTFCERAYKLGSWRSGDMALNAVTEECYDVAITAARRVDREASAEDWADKARLPLLGVPISLKEQIVQKGFDASLTMGAYCFRWGEDGSPEDGEALKLLVEAGAIPFVRSTVPQLVYAMETKSDFWGVTRNPYDLSRTPYGTSGGDAVLLATACSPLGVGSDLGGSIRATCQACGVYGLRPTLGRFTQRGFARPVKNDTPGQQLIVGTMGPLSNCVEDLAAVIRAWCLPRAWELNPALPQMPFDEATYAGRRGDGTRRLLSFAAVRTNGFFDPCETGVRAVDEAAAALRSAGHEVHDLEYPEDLQCWALAPLFTALLASEGNRASAIKALDGEPFDDLYNGENFIANLPNALRPVLSWYLGYCGERRMQPAPMCYRSGGLSARQYFGKVQEVLVVRDKFLDFLSQHGCDVLLTPTMPVPACLHGQGPKMTLAAMDMLTMTALNWPAGVLPVTHVRASEQHYPAEKLPAYQRDSTARLTAKLMEGSKGLPYGVQVSAPSYKEELVLYAMRELESSLPTFERLPPPPLPATASSD